jgi:hypothetical protein
MNLQACAHHGIATLRRPYAGRTVVSATGGPRTTAFVRPFVKENEK